MKNITWGRRAYAYERTSLLFILNGNNLSHDEAFTIDKNNQPYKHIKFTHLYRKAQYCRVSTSRLSPVQHSPPFDGGGLVQVLLRFLMPPPHFALHQLQYPKLLPATVNYTWENCIHECQDRSNLPSEQTKRGMIYWLMTDWLIWLHLWSFSFLRCVPIDHTNQGKKNVFWAPTMNSRKPGEASATN